MPKFPFAFGVAESPKGDSPYGAADTLSRGLRRILCGGTCKPIAGSHAAEPMGWISSYLDRRPLPRHGGGVGGRGRCACGYFGSVSVRSTDLDFSFKKNLNSYPALQATERGLSRGESVPLDRVLPTFARTKVGPRRVGVQMNTFCKTPRRRRRLQAFPRRAGVQFMPLQKAPRRRRRNKAGHSLCRQSLRFAPLTTSLYTREALGTCVQFMPLQKAPRRRRRLQS